MGTWGTGIYDNDIAADVRDEYISKLRGGKTDEEAMKEVLSENYTSFMDENEMYDVVLPLADTMWKYGRLDTDIREAALQLAAIELDTDRWKEEANRESRERHLKRLVKKLNSEMPARKRISIPRPFVSGWKEKEVYYYEMVNVPKGYEKYIGWYVLIYVDCIKVKDWYVKGIFDEVPEVYFFMQKNKPTDVSEIKTATPVCLLAASLASPSLKKYRARVMERSKRKWPKDLTFLGRYDEFVYPPNDHPTPQFFDWPLGNRNILWGYERQLKTKNQGSE